MKNDNRQSGFYLLSDNADAFVARFTLANSAKKTLDIQYYIMHNDASGQYLAYALLSAADRGVHVRILVDDINLSGRDNQLKMLSQHKNIEIRIFNPLANRDWLRNLELIINLEHAGRRMHNKTFVVDGKIAIIGGRNIGDEYFDARHSLNFVDLDLLCTGAIVNSIKNSFDSYWNCYWATAIEELNTTSVFKKQLKNIRRKLKDKWHRAKNTAYFHSLQQAELTKNIVNETVPYTWATAELFYDQPDKLSKNASDKTVHFGPQIFPYFQNAREQLLIASPYFVPGDEGTQWLAEKRTQGVEIKILTNSLAATDVAAVHAGYKKYRQQLLAADLDLFELKPTAHKKKSTAKKIMQGSSTASLHAKYMVVDQQFVFIGSANIDPRSKALNTEIGIMIKSKELALQTSELFQRTSSFENSYQVTISSSANKNDKNSDKDLIWLTEEDDHIVQYTEEPNAGVIKKLVVFIMSLLPIESLL